MTVKKKFPAKHRDMLQKKKTVAETSAMANISSRKYSEKDNQGDRLDRPAAGREYMEQTQQPFLQYSFDSRESAETALLMNPWIHIAADTNNLIATKPFTVGCYRRDDRQFEVVLGGEPMSSEVAREMKKHFTLLGGRKNGERTPAKTDDGQDGQRLREVVFLKEYTEISMEGALTCRKYRCEDPITATVFLKRRQNSVNRKDFRIVVETPKITYYRDFDGIHEET